MSTPAVRSDAAPVAVSLQELIALKPAGELLRLATPRVRAFAAGGHVSPFRGRGVEFDESRPYQDGDDLRTFDWRVTARTGRPHTKVFREERNRPVMLSLDLRAAMMFATRGAYKAVQAARLAALIGWSAVANGDQLGGLIFTASQHEELRPRLGRRAALRMMQLIATNPAWTGAGTGDAADAGTLALKRLTRVARPGSMAYLFSDFAALDDAFEKELRQLASHCDVQLVQIFDPVEAELPPPGRYRIEFGQGVHTIDTSDREFRAHYRHQFDERRKRLTTLARLPGVRLLACETGDDPVTVLARYFARR